MESDPAVSGSTVAWEAEKLFQSNAPLAGGRERIRAIDVAIASPQVVEVTDYPVVFGADPETENRRFLNE